MAQKSILTNPMRSVRIEKLTLNIGAGKDAALLAKGEKLITQLTGVKPIKTKTQKRIPGWGLRPGLPIGIKLTLRGKKAEELIPKFLTAKENKLHKTNFDQAGNVSFGIPEYIDIEGAKYDPTIGIIGLQACITFTRAGYHIKKRRIKTTKVGKRHRITPQDAKSFMEEKFKTKIEEE